MGLDELKLFLPKYLSGESEKILFDELKSFPDNIDGRVYTSYLKDQEIIFQGDGLKGLLAVNLPKTDVKTINGIILSNTCDVDVNNSRPFSSQLVYVPIIPLSSYASQLEKLRNSTQIRDHLGAIRKQIITQVFYLPKLDGVIEESIAFLDRIYHLPNSYVDRSELINIRLFTLSDYGIYLFLYKLSIHFTRIQDKVERRSIARN